MTIKEIAELCSVDERTVLRWAESLRNVNNGQNVGSLQNLDGITEESGHGKAVALPVETAAAVIRAGGKEALAFLLEEITATKNALAVQNEAMAKIAKLAEKLPELVEWFENNKNLPEQYQKFRGQTIEAVKGVKANFKELEASQKELEARVDGAYEKVRDSAAERAADHVREYLLTSHKPSAHEAQLAELKRFLSETIAVTGDRRDKMDFFRLWGPYETARSNPIPKDAFAAHVILLYPQIKFRGGVFIGVRFDY